MNSKEKKKPTTSFTREITFSHSRTNFWIHPHESIASTHGTTEETSWINQTCTWVPSSEKMAASETWLIEIFIKE